jgi:hypothetical protein
MPRRDAGATRRVSRLSLAGVVILIGLLLTSCTPTEKQAYYYVSRRMFVWHHAHFMDEWWQIQQRKWGRDNVRFAYDWAADIGEKPGSFYDYSTDFCSFGGSKGYTFDFRSACIAHDFGYRNFKRLDSRYFLRLLERPTQGRCRQSVAPDHVQALLRSKPFDPGILLRTR